MCGAASVMGIGGFLQVHEARAMGGEARCVGPGVWDQEYGSRYGDVAGLCSAVYILLLPAWY